MVQNCEVVLWNEQISLRRTSRCGKDRGKVSVDTSSLLLLPQGLLCPALGSFAGVVNIPSAALNRSISASKIWSADRKVVVNAHCRI